VKHIQVSIVARVEAALAWNYNVVSNHVSTTKTGKISNPASTVSCGVIIGDYELKSRHTKLYSSFCKIVSGIELYTGICQQNGLHSSNSNVDFTVFARDAANRFAAEIWMKACW
jgi:hypothetical protein